MKTIKDILEVYRPKSPDEQKFVDKHVTIKHKDRNGNSDDVFNGNTKYIKRKEERHGYDVNDDEKVYEDVEDLDELSQKMVRAYRDKARDDRESAEDDREYYKAHDDNTDAEDKKIAKRSAGIKMASKKIHGGAKVPVKEQEEAEIDALLDEALDILLSIDEKTLTPAEMKKREEVVKAIKRGNPKMDKSMAYAIATKTAKRVAEETEELDESDAHDAHFERQTPKVQTHINALLRRGHTYPQAVKKVNGATPLGESSDAYGKSIDDIKKKNITSSDKDKLARLHAMLSAEKKPVKEEAEELDELSSATLSNYVAKASNAKGHRNLPTKKVDNRYIGVKKASDRLNKEEAEQLDELSPKTLSSYAKKAVNQTFSKGVAGGMGLASSNKEDEASGHRQVNKAAKRMAGAQKAISKLTKEDIINRAIENYMPEDYELPSLEDRLLDRIEGLSENHAATLLTLFNSLSEDNQLVMLSAAMTEEGINELLNFAIENRGE